MWRCDFLVRVWVILRIVVLVEFIKLKVLGFVKEIDVMLLEKGGGVRGGGGEMMI